MAERADILVAEDDPIVAKLLNHTLSRRGFNVHHASDGQQASLLIHAMPPPRLALLDLMFPYLSGFQLIAQIRALPWRKVPIIVLTSMSQEASVVRASRPARTTTSSSRFVPMNSWRGSGVLPRWRYRDALLSHTPAASSADDPVWTYRRDGANHYRCHPAIRRQRGNAGPHRSADVAADGDPFEWRRGLARRLFRDHQ